MHLLKKLHIATLMVMFAEASDLHLFTFMHLADTFIQSDLHCIQVTVLHFISSCFPWESKPWSWASAMLYYLSYRKAVAQIVDLLWFTKLGVLTSRACRRKVLFSDLAHSMHSKHNSTSWPVAASMSKNISSRERTNRAAFALLMEFRNGRTYFSKPPNSAKYQYMRNRY